MLRSDINAHEDELFEQFERLERADCIACCHTCHRALLLDCAEINRALASSLTDFPMRLNRPLAMLCAELGERCSAECARCIDEDDGETCIGACARSVRACRRFAELETLQ